MKEKLTVRYRKVDALIPYVGNSRTHSDEQVAQIAASIREFGFTNPILTDGENGIIAGHGRLMAARKLAMDEVPTIELAGLTAAQKRAYVIADNKLALNAGWDMAALKIEFSQLGDDGFDLRLTGFALDEIAGIFDEAPSLEKVEEAPEAYTRKIEAPIYEITGACPSVAELFDRSKAQSLIDEIDKASLPKEVDKFLRSAAERHTVFNFRNIAEFYAHADPDTQSLMERSALVIIDFNKAIEEGFVKLTSAVMDQYARDYADA
jgi:hypothetical protein